VENRWLTAKLPKVEEIQNRLKKIFPREIDTNGYIIREMGAKTVYTMLYGFCVGGNEWIRPATITCMTDEQAAIQSLESRKQWLFMSQGQKRQETFLVDGINPIPANLSETRQYVKWFDLMLF
jgi:hypothetical protein